jgi:hypothetical protein
MPTLPEIENQAEVAKREPSSAAPRSQTGCCGGPVPETSGACCALDAEVKAKGGQGCDCAPRAVQRTKAKTSCC